MPIWTPESSTALTEELEIDRLEETLNKLWAEWLHGYFDGGTHYLIKYPSLAAIVYQTNPTKQELAGVAIHILTNLPTVNSRRRDGSGSLALSTDVKWTFVVKAAIKPTIDNSESLARNTADLLFSLLNKPDHTLVLNRAGIGNIRVTPPALQISEEYKARKVAVTARVRVRVTPPVSELLESLGGDTLII